MSTGREILNDFFQEEHTIFKKFLAASLKYTGRPRKIGQFFFQIVIHFHPGHLLSKILINTDFFPLVG